MPTITIQDETTGKRSATRTFTLEFLDETVTARELIRRRVYDEVQDYNLRQPERYRGLVEPTDAERDMNGYKLKPGRKIDWAVQFERALEAFARNGFIMLVNDTQIEHLDEAVALREGTTVTFLKLVPLVGG